MVEKIGVGILVVLAIGFLVLVLVAVGRSADYEVLCRQNGYITAEAMFGKTYCIGTNTDGTLISIPLEDLRGQGQ